MKRLQTHRLHVYLSRFEIRSSIPGKGDYLRRKIEVQQHRRMEQFQGDPPVKLSSRLAGKRNIMFVINGNAASDFAGWKCQK